MKPMSISAMVLFIAIALAQTQVTVAQAGPEAVVQSFYAWYLHALNQNQDPLEKQQAQLSKFITQRLLKSLNRALKRPDGIDADFFIDAQDWDQAWEKNISTSKAIIQGSLATVTVTLKGGAGFGIKKLKVGLRKEYGAWKIDKINNRTSP